MIARSIEAWNTQQASELEQLLFRQRKRLADAERTLRTKSTKKTLDTAEVTAKVNAEINAVLKSPEFIERLKTLRAEIEAGGGDAHVVELDVTDIGSIKAAVAHAETEMGSIDILVNNSGVSTTQRLQDVTEEDYDFVLDTNTKGAFFVAQEVGKRMIARAKTVLREKSPKVKV